MVGFLASNKIRVVNLEPMTVMARVLAWYITVNKTLNICREGKLGRGCVGYIVTVTVAVRPAPHQVVEQGSVRWWS